jgi:hypothetical protein
MSRCRSRRARTPDCRYTQPTQLVGVQGMPRACRSSRTQAHILSFQNTLRTAFYQRTILRYNWRIGSLRRDSRLPRETGSFPATSSVLCRCNSQLQTAPQRSQVGQHILASNTHQHHNIHMSCLIARTELRFIERLCNQMLQVPGLVKLEFQQLEIT